MIGLRTKARAALSIRRIISGLTEQLIAQMHALHLQATEDADLDWKQFESHYNRLQKAWRSVGKVDPKTYRVLNERYKAEQQLVVSSLNAFHKGNAALKNELVEQAQQLSQSDNLAEACTPT